MPDPPVGPPVQLLSVDGAMVPLVAGDWAEAKSLALGTVRVDEVGTATTGDLSYVSRLADAETFGRLATGETHRRGTATAGTVVAVTDGAGWCQGFVDVHRPDAVRMLDVSHAVGHLGQVAQAFFGLGTAAASTWLADQASALRHGGEAAVLTELTARATASGEDPATRQRLPQTHAYLATRRTQIQYAAFGEAGSPIGSGCIESANKLIVEARRKGDGMYWARSNVNPMLALRTVDANARWAEAWPAIWEHLRHPRRRPCRQPYVPRPSSTADQPPTTPGTAPLPSVQKDEAHPQVGNCSDLGVRVRQGITTSLTNVLPLVVHSLHSHGLGMAKAILSVSDSAPITRGCPGAWWGHIR